MTIRLNKATRDLNVGITTVVEFLQKKGYDIQASPNAKITEEQYAELVKEFSTDIPFSALLKLIAPMATSKNTGTRMTTPLKDKT